MAFDQTTRNRLARFVGDCRSLLSEEFTRQLQSIYGMNPESADTADLDSLSLTSTQYETARLLRETFAHYLAGQTKQDKKTRVDVLSRIVREQAFTVLNRLCAIRMAESRDLVIECIGQGYQSKGFKLFQQLAKTSLGETGDAYRVFLFSVFDEFAVDLPVLFDRFSPQGRLFPREAALLEVLRQINHADIDPLWAEDETIGWIYQYFNSVEERREMRAASQAPRNSRELAVRNQFFTPRYVVEFLTDNTLGRIWYEMTQGQTALKDSCRYLVRRPNEIFLAEGEEAPEQAEQAEDLSQEELLKQPVHIPHRPLKDPRDIKMLDPACGSMHFGLYAFDLFERIYYEAWDLEGEHASGGGADAFVRPEGLKPLHDTYENKGAFLRDVPRLIIERNIHGIDIDPRAVQIAGLSLWLRAQKSWQNQNVKAQDRPQIQRSNIVCAEPMPGEADMLEEFLESLRNSRLESLIRRVLNVPENQQVRATPRMADALCDIVRSVWKEMELAGEAGSLLKIEESLAEAIAKGKEEWEDKLPLFRVTEFGLTEETQANLKVKYYKSVPGEEEDFWNRAEAMVLAALEDYAEHAQGSEAARRRMFAEDAARGFAFIDLVRRRFDAAVMNPPFGLVPDRIFAYSQKRYPDTYVDVYGSFVVRSVELSANGLVGAITSRSFIMSKKLERWRDNQLIPNVEVLADLGGGVMDSALIDSAAYVVRAKHSPSQMLLGFDARKPSDRQTALLACTQLVGDNHDVYLVKRRELAELPGKKLLYFISSHLSELIRHSDRFEPTVGTVRGGMRTFDDFRFLRLRWEIPLDGIGAGWELYAKGGEYALYYTDVHLVVNRGQSGAELAEKNRQVNGQVAQSRQGLSYYYRPGCQYTGRSAKGFSARAIPAGCVMSSNAPMVFSESDVTSTYILGWLNSRLIRSIIQMQAMADDYVPGIVKHLPWVSPPEDSVREIEEACRIAILGYRHFAAHDETDPLFCGLGPGCQQNLGRFVKAASTALMELQQKVLAAQQRMTQAIDDVYGVSSEDLGAEVLEKNVLEEFAGSIPSAKEWAFRFVSCAVGIALGRWDAQVVADGCPAESMPDPFAVLPDMPPASRVDGGHRSTGNPSGVAANPIMCDDATSTFDIVNASRIALEHVWGDSAETNEQRVCDLMRASSLRDYIGSTSKYFDAHLRRHSQSRRAAPIYWSLSTPTGSYTLWLYYHRLTDQTLYTCVNDFVEPKLKQVSDDASRLRAKSNRSSAEEKELERLSDLELELKDFRDELLRIAEFWKPDLNDGVQITAAPLWKLFRHRQWSSRLKETWEKLEAGEYDWAHLALSIWPDRVVRASHKDRSYAIAHDLEDQLWHEVEVEKKTKGGKVKKVVEWRPRDLSEDEIREIVDAVKQGQGLATGGRR